MFTFSPSTWRSVASSSARRRLKGQFYSTAGWRAQSSTGPTRAFGGDGGLRENSFLGRFAQGLGHVVRLISPIYVKPFVKRQKNDAADAAAIADAAFRPNLHYVAVKRAELGFVRFSSGPGPKDAVVCDVVESLIEGQDASAHVVGIFPFSPM